MFIMLLLLCIIMYYYSNILPYNSSLRLCKKTLQKSLTLHVYSGQFLCVGRRRSCVVAVQAVCVYIRA